MSWSVVIPECTGDPVKYTVEVVCCTHFELVSLVEVMESPIETQQPSLTIVDCTAATSQDCDVKIVEETTSDDDKSDVSYYKIPDSVSLDKRIGSCQQSTDAASSGCPTECSGDYVALVLCCAAHTALGPDLSKELLCDEDGVAER